MSKSKQIQVRFTPAEAKRIKEICKVNSGTVSDFVRACVNNQLAQVGDPKGMEMLTAQFEQGMHRMIKMRVKEELEKAKREYEKKRA